MVFLKVETASITNDQTGSGYLIAVAIGTAIAILFICVVFTVLWRYGAVSACLPVVAQPRASRNDAARHDEEKSNNLQNEENFRRYANPLKGSATSLRGAIELSHTPAPEVALVSPMTAGPSALHRSQPLFPACGTSDGEFDKDPDTVKPHRGSQILLFKAQNPDMHKNTIGTMDSPHKDFGKRSINCQTLPTGVTSPVMLDPDVMAVHV